MTIGTKRTAKGKLLVTLDGKRTSLDNAVKTAILENRGDPITIDNGRANYNYFGHIHYSASNFSLEFDCRALKAAVRDFADWR